MAAQDQPNQKAWGEVTVDLQTRLGVKVDYAAVDWGTVVARRAQKNEPGQGGWQMYHTSLSGADCIDPTNKLIRADGSLSTNGWPTVRLSKPRLPLGSTRRRSTRKRPSPADNAALDHVVYAPFGFFLRRFAWRKSLTGVAHGPLPFFWGVSKTA
jgi:peptide/nickel transport system substrate-binding protein